MYLSEKTQSSKRINLANDSLLLPERSIHCCLRLHEKFTRGVEDQPTFYLL